MDFGGQQFVSVGSLILTNVPLWLGGINEGGYMCVDARGVWEISVPSIQFCIDSKTALKITVYFISKIIQNKLITKMKKCLQILV